MNTVARSLVALLILLSGCADVRYRAATKDITYHLGQDQVIDCWMSSPDLAYRECQDDAAKPALDACAKELAASNHSILVGKIRDELQACMKSKGWVVGPYANIWS